MAAERAAVELAWGEVAAVKAAAAQVAEVRMEAEADVEGGGVCEGGRG